MNRRGTLAALAGLFATLPVLQRGAAAAEAKTAHRLALHVDQNDAAVMSLALGNAGNVQSYFDERGESVAIEIVAYGPGLHMLRQDSSPVKERIAAMSEKNPHLVFSACNNTKQRMEAIEGKEIVLLPQAKLVPAGVVRLMLLQEEGWAYVRP